MHQEKSLCSGKDCCVPVSIVVFSKRLLCSRKDCCVLKKIVAMSKRLLCSSKEGALYKEVFPRKTEASLSITVDVRGSNSKWRAICILER